MSPLLIIIRCKKLQCLHLENVYPDLPADLLNKCNTLENIILSENNLNEDQLLDILNPLKNVSTLKIDEKAIACPICNKDNEENCSCPYIEKIERFTWNMAVKSEIYCYDGSSTKKTLENRDVRDRLKDAIRNCETWATKRQLYYAVVSSGMFYFIKKVN